VKKNSIISNIRKATFKSKWKFIPINYILIVIKRGIILGISNPYLVEEIILGFIIMCCDIEKKYFLSFLNYNENIMS